MKNYIFGLIKYLTYTRVSAFAKITYKSEISKKAKINRFVKVFNCTIGDYSYVGSNSELVNVTVGKFCSIASKCSIGLASHTLNFISTSPIFTLKNNGTGFSWVKMDITGIANNKVSIGNDVWIGNKATIIGNVKVGNGAIIGAGAIVTKDVPNYAIVVGVPAKVIKYRFPDDVIEKLNSLEWWNFPTDLLKKNIYYFQKQLSDLELDQLIYNVKN